MGKEESAIKSLVYAALRRFVMVGVTWTALIVCVFASFIGLGFMGFIFAADELEDTSATSSYSTIYGTGYNQLLSIKVDGTIYGSEGGGLMDAYTSGYHVKEQLQAAADNPDIWGVILEVSSPGGTIYGSRAIADGVTYYQEKTGQPVYAYVEGVAASGGYWAIASTDKIIADHGSDVGSIGVIMGPFQYYNNLIAEDGGLFNGGVITEKGIENTMITAGKSKDVGSPYRRLSQEEVASLQKSVNDEYDGFVSYVSEHRHIPADTIKNKIGAMIYGNKTAQELKLIDVTGSRDAAYADLAKAADIEDDFQIVREEYIPGLLESLVFSHFRAPQKQASFDPCTLTRGSLVYHGDPTTFCAK